MLRSIIDTYEDYRGLSFIKRLLVRFVMFLCALSTGFALRFLVADWPILHKAFLGVVIAVPIILLSGWGSVRIFCPKV